MHYSRDLERPPTLPSPPRRTKTLDRRTREYLTPAEVEKLLLASAKVGRHGARDRTLILLAYRHRLPQVRIFLTRIDSRTKDAAEMLVFLHEQKLPVLSSRACERAAYRRAIGEGAIVQELGRDPPSSSQEMEAFLAEVTALNLSPTSKRFSRVVPRPTGNRSPVHRGHKARSP